MNKEWIWDNTACPSKTKPDDNVIRTKIIAQKFPIFSKMTVHVCATGDN